MRFSVTERGSTSMKCWCTMPMPRAMASRALRMATWRPSTAMVPSSGCCSPYSTFISVDLPAPFSPMRAWTSPHSTSKSTSSLATTSGKRFVMPRILTAGGMPKYTVWYAGSRRCPASQNLSGATRP